MTEGNLERAEHHVLLTAEGNLDVIVECTHNPRGTGSRIGRHGDDVLRNLRQKRDATHKKFGAAVV